MVSRGRCKRNPPFHSWGTMRAKPSLLILNGRCKQPPSLDYSGGESQVSSGSNPILPSTLVHRQGERRTLLNSIVKQCVRLLLAHISPSFPLLHGGYKQHRNFYSWREDASHTLPSTLIHRQDESSTLIYSIVKECVRLLLAHITPSFPHLKVGCKQHRTLQYSRGGCELGLGSHSTLPSTFVGRMQSAPSSTGQ